MSNIKESNQPLTGYKEQHISAFNDDDESLVGGFVNGVNGLTRGIANIAGGTLDAAGNIVGDVVDTAEEIVSDLSDVAEAGTMRVVRGLGGMTADFGGDVSQIVNNFGNNLGNGMEGIVDGVGNTVSDVLPGKNKSDIFNFLCLCVIVYLLYRYFAK